MQQTAEEARTERINAMGEDLGSLFDALWQQLNFAKMKWREYVSLYGTNEKRIALLNAAAPRFFGRLDAILWEDILLHIARLTDSPSTFGRQDRANLSIRALPPLINDLSLRDTVTQRVRSAVDAAEFARDWRNRHIAHRDLQRALERDAEPLAFASRACVNGAFEKMQAVMNTIQVHYLDSETHYDVPNSSGSATSLLHEIGRASCRERV